MPNFYSFSYFSDQYTFTTSYRQKKTKKQILCTALFEAISLPLPWRKILYPAIYAEVKHIDAPDMG